MILSRILALLIGYVFGLFETGYFYSKKQQIDLRRRGSGNIGATNTTRVMGVKAGIIVLVGDALKAFLALFAVRLLFRHAYPEGVCLLQFYAGAGVILGHDFPFYLQFKGGKGVASTFGIVAGSYPLMLIPEALIFFAILFATQYVALCSMVCYTLLPIVFLAMSHMGWITVPAAYVPEIAILLALLALLTLWQHRSNIVRLKNGEESKFFDSLKKKEV